VRTLKQPVARLLVRGILVAAVSACSVAAWAQNSGQGTSQGSSTPPGKSSVAPPPADLEPGVNTSATQLSSPEPAPTPAVVSPPKPAPKRAQTSPKSAASANPSGAPSSTGAESTAGSSVAAGAAASGSAKGASTAAPANVATAAARASKPGAPGGKAHDSIELDTTQITGNRELPKVLYIVPWKRSDLGDLVGKPVNSILDEVLTPVDRDVFKRQNRYYDALKPDDAKDAAPAATGANEKH
jgi:hypothetical protein